MTVGQVYILVKDFVAISGTDILFNGCKSQGVPLLTLVPPELLKLYSFPNDRAFDKVTLVVLEVPLNVEGCVRALFVEEAMIALIQVAHLEMSDSFRLLS